MWKGEVISMGIASAERADIQSKDVIEVFAGKGILGDRYYQKFEAEPDSYSPEKEITLIELEAIEALMRDHQIDLDPLQSRRNIVTRGVPLNHLVNREFVVGVVKLKGIELCEPCATLEGMTQKGIIGGLVHRGGLRAQILSDGKIRRGDSVKLVT